MYLSIRFVWSIATILAGSDSNRFLCELNVVHLSSSQQSHNCSMHGIISHLHHYQLPVHNLHSIQAANVFVMMELFLCTESVREACITQLVEAWLRTYNGDHLSLLALLDIENSSDVCQTLLQVLFKKSTPLALTENLTFLNEEFVYSCYISNSEILHYFSTLCLF